MSLDQDEEAQGPSRPFASLLPKIAAILVLLIPAGAYLAYTGTPDRVIYAPTSTLSGAPFVVAMDTGGCTKLPVVTWSVATGCQVVTGQGLATATLVCNGARGADAQINAAASGGRPASCNGPALPTDVVISGGEDIPMCADASSDGATPSPVVPLPPARLYYRPGILSTGRIRLEIGTCIEPDSQKDAP